LRTQRRKRRRRIQPDLSTVKRNKRIKRNGTNNLWFGYNNRNGGSVNGIGEEEGQYDQYYNEHGGQDDTPSLNNVNGELDQENY
jgi:hypothetical protein